MQRTLLIANTVLIIAVGGFVLPMFMDSKTIRQQIDQLTFATDSNGIILKEHTEQFHKISLEKDTNTKVMEAMQESISQLQESVTKVQTTLTEQEPLDKQTQDKLAALLATQTKQGQALAILQPAIEKIATDSKTRYDQIHEVTQSQSMLIEQLQTDIDVLRNAMINKTAPPAVSQTNAFTKPETPVVEHGKAAMTKSDMLAGTWLLTMPAGFQRDITIVKLSDDTINLNTGGNLNGTFRIQKNKLVSINVTSENFLEYTWQIESLNRIRLIYSKTTKRVGNDYTGATLTRK